MKFTTRLLTAAAALMLASTASADVTIYLTGSTAFRGATSNAIKNLFSSLSGTGSYNDGTTNHTGVTYGYVYDGSSFTGASHQMFIGTVTGITGTVVVKTSWSGSLQGIQSLDQPATVTNAFFDYPWVNGSVVVSSGGTNNTTAGLTNDHSNATLAMADNTQGATPFNNTTLTDNEVGIVPFVFVAGYSAPSGVTNVTPQLAQALWESGYCSAALFTNNAADQDNSGGTRIYAAGRDPLSGTRLNTFAETGIGINTAPAQYQYVSAPTGTNPITSIELVPADSTLLTPVGQNPGETGFSSGGTLANMMRYAMPSITFGGRTGKACFVTYLGESDAVTAVQTGTAGSGNGRLLTYNGVSAFGGLQVSATDCSWTSGSSTITSATTGKWAGCVVGQLVRCTGFGGDTIITAIDGTNTILTVSKTATTTQASGGSVSTSIILPTPIWNGTYTMWGYEHIMWAPGTSGDQLTFGNKLKTQISTVDYYTSGLALDSAMKVSRQSEGGIVTQSY
jgi:hypothetical protein